MEPLTDDLLYPLLDRTAYESQSLKASLGVEATRLNPKHQPARRMALDIPNVPFSSKIPGRVEVCSSYPLDALFHIYLGWHDPLAMPPPHGPGPELQLVPSVDEAHLPFPAITRDISSPRSRCRPGVEATKNPSPLKFQSVPPYRCGQSGPPTDL